VDNVPPCKPTGDIQVSCDSLKSTVSWVIEDENCAEDVSKILIYYRAAGLEDSVLLVELSPSDPPIFEHFQTESVAGCYYISFVDSFLNQGLQEVLCADNCPVYELPNTFSPNGDEFNDLFGPFPYAFIESIDFKVFNRWGNEVFSTDNIDIEWNGKNQGTGDLLPDGVYYYICIVNEIRLVGIVPRTLKGTIQLFGIKQNSSE
jgi:gliding motility-associated-like protein